MSKPVDALDYFKHGAMVGQNFNLSQFRDLNMKGVHMENCTFFGADLTKCDFSGAFMYRCQFSRADLTLCDFTGAEMNNCDFTGSHARGTIFLRTRLINAIIRRVTWKNCIFAYADLNGCELLQNDFLGTRWYKCDGLDNVRYGHTSIFRWYRMPGKDVPPVFEPTAGYVEHRASTYGGFSTHENEGGIKGAREEIVAPMGVAVG